MAGFDTIRINQSRPISLKGKALLVIVGSSGIGLAIAHQAATAGASLLIVTHDPAKLEAAATALRQRGLIANVSV